MKQFDDIRPYYDEEIPEAMKRIASSESFPFLVSYIYPGESIEKIRDKISNFKTIREFQYDTMKMVNEQVIKRSITNYSCIGLEKLDPQKSYLFVSNHRDIVLDSSLLQYSLVSNGFDTTEITFGANLMHQGVVTDIGKSNKMFRVERPGGGIKEFYQKSLHLSEYIHYTIVDKKQSVWIAQRNGRTKDGNDRTDQGIIKMFCMANPADKIKVLDELNIVPVVISYEWESCDILKTLELFQSQNGKYIKKPGEDLNSILTGITQPKGNVHIEICDPITTDELMSYGDLTCNAYNKAVSLLLDERIQSSYLLYANNFIAHDLLYGNEKYISCYNDDQKRLFIEHMNKLEQFDVCNFERLKEIFLGIYSNPVDNKRDIR